MLVTDLGRYALTPDTITFTVCCPKGTPNFSGLATSNLPKLYVAGIGGEPVYVGITKQSMRSRLRYGWAANGKSGYYGYAWRHQLTTIDLDIWCHEDPPTRNECLDIETIEAELVYLIRKSGQWPKYQTEIHFHPSSAEHRRIAAVIGARYGLLP